MLDLCSPRNSAVDRLASCRSHRTPIGIGSAAEHRPWPATQIFRDLRTNTSNLHCSLHTTTCRATRLRASFRDSGESYGLPSKCSPTEYELLSDAAPSHANPNQGYELTDDECNISLDDFRDQFADQNGIPERTKMAFTARPSAAMQKKYTPITRPGQPEKEAEVGLVHVEFFNDPNVGIKHIKNFAQLLSEKNYYTGIFVTQQAPTSAAVKIIPSIHPIIMEIFREEDLLVNISRHDLVPKHILLSAEEKRGLLERYRLKETQLPRIRVDDPMAKYLGLRRAQVVKIIRKSETAGRYASYRWVV